MKGQAVSRQWAARIALGAAIAAVAASTLIAGVWDPWGVRASVATDVSREQMALVVCSIAATNEQRAIGLRIAKNPGAERRAAEAEAIGQQLRHLASDLLSHDCGPTEGTVQPRPKDQG